MPLSLRVARIMIITSASWIKNRPTIWKRALPPSPDFVNNLELLQKVIHKTRQLPEVNCMRINPILQKMGFDANDRVMIIHADDIGMCQATLPAFEALIEFGLVSSGSLMVPCP